MVSSKIIWESGVVTRAGNKDSLLTAGLSLEELQSPLPPPDCTPRVAAIHKDFRDLVDVSSGGGFIENVGRQALDITGREYAALLQLPGLAYPVSVLVLVPDNFDWDRPIMVVAPSSGSRGVTGAIGDIGAWALPNNCALVLTDKGTGCGAHLLETDECYGPDLVPATDPETPTTFRVKKSWSLNRYRKRVPRAIALKHAHSAENIEVHWPSIVLAAAQYGLTVLKEREGTGRSKKDLNRIRIIAAGVSNGGGAVLRAAEQDRKRLIDGVVAVEPNITPKNNGVTIIEGTRPVINAGRPLLDYATAMNLYLPAALRAQELGDQPYAEVSSIREEQQTLWARKLGALGLIAGSTVSELGADALRKIRAFGFDQNTDPLAHMMAMMHIWPAVAYTFVSAYGRYRVQDALLGAHLSFVTTDELGLTLSEVRGPTLQEKQLYGALGGGLSPGGGVFTIYRDGDIHPSVDDALTLRGLATGRRRADRKVQRGAAQVLAKARSSGHPTILLHGRCDSLININHTSRAYMAAVSASGSNTKNWRYYEHDKGQHFETLLMVPGLSERFNPLLPAFFEALDLMRDHLFDAMPLPPSQVLRSELPTSTGADGLAIRDQKNFATIRQIPQQQDKISLTNKALHIPV